MSKTPKKTDKNTIFSYFKTTPKSAEPNELNIGSNNNKVESLFYEGDIVWTKLEGHPWWPAMITKHPIENKITKPQCSNETKKRSKLRNKPIQLYHVQFFEDPPSRGWIKEKFVKKFLGCTDKDCERGGLYFSPKLTWAKCVEKAVEANSMSLDQKLLLVRNIPSDNEIDDNDDEDAENDDLMMDCHDNCNILKSSDESKENMSPDDETSAKPTRTGRNKLKKRRLLESDDDDDVQKQDSEDEFKPDKSGTVSSSSSSSGEEGEDKEVVVSSEECNELDDSDLIFSVQINKSKKKKVPTATLR